MFDVPIHQAKQTHLPVRTYGTRYVVGYYASTRMKTLCYYSEISRVKLSGPRTPKTQDIFRRYGTYRSTSTRLLIVGYVLSTLRTQSALTTGTRYRTTGSTCPSSQLFVICSNNGIL